MRSKRMAALVAAGALAVALPQTASANLALQLGRSVSSLSCQLLKKPRSSAGNQKNVWDADPPVAADSGFHYFLYNIDADLNPLPLAQQTITLQSFLPGPGYLATVQVLVNDGNGPFFTPMPQSDVPYDYTGLLELGVARVAFQLAGAPGQIEGPDEEELDYAGLDDDNNPATPDLRGFEHVRFETEYLSSTDDRPVYGLMTAVMPPSFAGLTPSGGFDEGVLTFDELGETFAGSAINPAFVMSPEPAALATLLLAAPIVRRRRRA